MGYDTNFVRSRYLMATDSKLVKVRDEFIKAKHLLFVGGAI